MKELLSPAGNMDALKTAIHNGADAVYLGGKVFGARHYASNFSDEELKEATCYAHLYGVKVYVTCNIIIYNNEVDSFVQYIKYLYTIGVDALIMQDIGMIYLVHNKFPNIEINASTQAHIHNNNGINLVRELGIDKVVVDRELSLDEINNLDNSIKKEVFIHGALCNSFSGCCLFSSMNGSRSGNRGECVQSCRRKYSLYINGNKVSDYKYLLSTKELNTMDKFREILSSNIDSFKIEGRMKSPSYVGYVTGIYRKLIDNPDYVISSEEYDNIKILFNRGFTNGYLFNNNILNINSQNHLGLNIGSVVKFDKKRIYIKLNRDLYQDDGIRFKNCNLGMIVSKIYNKKDLLVNKGLKGTTISVDNKINLNKFDDVVKTSSIYLDKEISNYEEKKINLDIIFDNGIVTFTDEDGNSVSDNINVYGAWKVSTGKEVIIDKLSKLGNTIFKARDIKINIDNNKFISMKDLNDIRRSLVDRLISIRTKINRDIIINDFNLDYEYKKDYNYEVSVLARTDEQVKAALDFNVDRIYVYSDLYDKYKSDSRFYLRVDRVNINYDKYKDINNALVTEYGGIDYFKDKNMIGDYFLNIVNNYNIKYLLDKGVKRVTLSPEINYDNIDDFILDKVEILIYGRIELMITKSCVMKEFTDIVTKDDKYLLEDECHNKYPIIYDGKYTHIMHSKNINYFDKLDYYKTAGVKSFRLELFDESYEEVISLLKLFTKI